MTKFKWTIPTLWRVFWSTDGGDFKGLLDELATDPSTEDLWAGFILFFLAMLVAGILVFLIWLSGGWLLMILLGLVYGYDFIRLFHYIRS